MKKSKMMLPAALILLFSIRLRLMPCMFNWQATLETKLLAGTLNDLDVVKKAEMSEAISEIQAIADSIALVDSLITIQSSSTILDLRAELIENIFTHL
ncbi:MAG: hypothetical protein IPG39_10185 [Bacteroidetes bacterium]|nr:hypothetical protein [Bacteroidota bacterium]